MIPLILQLHPWMLTVLLFLRRKLFCRWEQMPRHKFLPRQPREFSGTVVVDTGDKGPDEDSVAFAQSGLIPEDELAKPHRRRVHPPFSAMLFWESPLEERGKNSPKTAVKFPLCKSWKGRSIRRNQWFL
jgi:hypothetical protein